MFVFILNRKMWFIDVNMFWVCVSFMLLDCFNLVVINLTRKSHTIWSIVGIGEQVMSRSCPLF